jgi:hypothetical protein
MRFDVAATAGVSTCSDAEALLRLKGALDVKIMAKQ